MHIRLFNFLAMLRIIIFALLTMSISPIFAQNHMTPELLWSLGRVSAQGLTEDGKDVIYSVTHYDAKENTKSTKHYSIPIKGGTAKEIKDPSKLVADKHISPDGRYILSVSDIKIDKVAGKDFHPDLDKSDVQIYDNLMYRHWDTWEDGAFSHLFVHPYENQVKGEGMDIMKDEPYDCPTTPFGGDEDYTWSTDSKKILYVTKKSSGSTYAQSTNSDIYAFDLATKNTTNLTKDNPGYDTQPAFSKDGKLAWLRMETPGYEADKNDIILDINGTYMNLTGHWDGTVNGFRWSTDGKTIYFNAPVDGTVQIFEIKVPTKKEMVAELHQITRGQFDVRGIVGQSGNTMVVSRTDMNHAAELFTLNLNNGEMRQLTHVNDALYAKIGTSKVEKRMIPTTDGKEMLTWVIYPPDFDPTKKYPTLLDCQGGPQGALSQFYSFRWNFQLMAAQGYIVVAPNRRGMPGHGVEWNEQISGDWGGQNMQDYLSAIDALAEEPYVDNDKLGCVGASYGGYSAFYLAGIHEGRFKSFIAHDGVFNLRSMYGTTEELFFVNYELGGPYWESNATTNKSYKYFNPIEKVSEWDTPIMIFQGGKDYRVPIGQSLEAFQAAQVRGIKSKLVYFPEENHWVLSAQNALVWQREFYKWLDETVVNPPNRS